MKNDLFKRMAFGMLAVCLLVICTNAKSALAATTVVTADNPNGWWFFQETATGSGTFTNGPSTPPLGTGSVELTINSTGGEIFGTHAFVGTRLDAITSLAYSTYRTSGNPSFAPSLQLDIDTNTTDINTAWQGRLVYEPYFTHTITTGVWHSWNPLDNAGTGNWWFTGAPGNVTCKMSNPCTWSELLAAFPDAGIRSAGANTGAVQFKVGGGWASGFVGNVDAFSIGVNGTVSTYDFQLTAAQQNTEAPRADLTVVKTVINDNGGTKTLGDFALFVDGNGHSSVFPGQSVSFPVSEQAYIVTETPDSGYALSYSGDCDSQGRVLLSASDNKVCILTNNDIGAPATVPAAPPLIDVVKVPSPLSLPAGPGPVLYTYILRNIGIVPVTNITMVGDSCSPVVRIAGDTNNNAIT